MRRRFYDEDHEAFRSAVREFVEREVVPYQQGWEEAGHIDPALWVAAGRQGLLGIHFPEAYGGGGVDDFRYRCVVMEELARVGAASVNSAMQLVDDLVGPYLVDLGTDEQQARWLPGLISGSSFFEAPDLFSPRGSTSAKRLMKHASNGLQPAWAARSNCCGRRLSSASPRSMEALTPAGPG